MRLGEILTLVWDHWWCISGFPEFWAAILKNTQYWSWKLTQHWDLSELTGEFGKDTSLILFSPLNPHLTDQNCSVVIFPFGGVLNSVSFALVVNKYCATLHAKGVRSRRVSHIHLKKWACSVTGKFQNLYLIWSFWVSNACLSFGVVLMAGTSLAAGWVTELKLTGVSSSGGCGALSGWQIFGNHPSAHCP